MKFSMYIIDVAKETTNIPEQRIGYSFVPVQKFRDIYSPEEGHQNGTLFKELNLPINVYGMN